MKSKSIFIIKVFYLDLKSKKARIVRDRIWGFYHSKKTALACIKENWTDIYENGYYNFSAILEFKEGVCVSSENADWFEIIYKSNTPKISQNPRVKKINYDPININRSSLNFKYFIGW